MLGGESETLVGPPREVPHHPQVVHAVTRSGNLRVIDAAGRDVDPRALDWSRWASAGDFPYQLRQDPGPTNPLGRVKLLFPNPYTVYLHDTPNPELFQRPVRAAAAFALAFVPVRAEGRMRGEREQVEVE